MESPDALAPAAAPAPADAAPAPAAAAGSSLPPAALRAAPTGPLPGFIRGRVAAVLAEEGGDADAARAVSSQCVWQYVIML